ncbi:dihydrodipicolinate synthase family protein [Aquabacter cavernae]|uniref:dihydrodipicolinate synthase family protein n=1 Tax=Aquabacter cavernae TaxID=2496029 RepID=UPI0013DF92D4|nr:dihydrodipicolinate synthase family protein [Aquabacter cavernae]
MTATDTSPWGQKGAPWAVLSLVTPFRDGELDVPALSRLLAAHAALPADGVLVTSEMGESATLRREERIQIVHLARRLLPASMRVIAAMGTNATEPTLAEALRVAEAGADMLLLRTPYYNRPTQSGLAAHAERVAESCGLPVLLDQDPDRSGIAYAPATLEALARHPRIVGLREVRFEPGASTLLAARCGPCFLRLCADPRLLAAHLASGGQGIVSPYGLIAADLVLALLDAWRAWRLCDLRTAQEKLAWALADHGGEADPAGVKFALSRMGLLPHPDVRLPLVGPDAAARTAWTATLARLRDGPQGLRRTG